MGEGDEVLGWGLWDCFFLGWGGWGEGGGLEGEFGVGEGGEDGEFLFDWGGGFLEGGEWVVGWVFWGDGEMSEEVWGGLLDVVG